MPGNAVRSLSAEYIWPEPKIDALRAALDDPVTAFLGDTRAHVTATIDDSFQVETTYNSVQEWLAESELSTCRFWASLNSGSRERSISLNWRPEDASLSLTCTTPLSHD